MSIPIKVNRSEINAMDLSHLQKYVDGHENSVYFNMSAGYEHYRLLANIAAAMPKGSTVYDIGTYLGYSATALAFNPEIKVITYDLKDSIPNKEAREPLTNIEYRIGNCLEDAEEIAKQSNLIMIDVDPHDGIQEKEMLDAFTKAGFKGLMVFSDINLTLLPEISATPFSETAGINQVFRFGG